MKITLHYPAMMRIEAAPSGADVALPDNATIELLLKNLALSAEHVRYILVYVNGERRGLSHTLTHNDVVKLYLPVGGG
jgi:sulfur carrier protein ThiS